MRRFTDGTGREWDVVLGRESWGTSVALFVPVRTGVAARQAPLAASDQVNAELELDEMNAGQLQQLLDRSSEKEG